MNKFFIRASTALVFAAILIFGILLNQWSFLIIMTMILTGCIWEYFTISQPLFRKDVNFSKQYKYIVLSIALVSFFIAFLASIQLIPYSWIFIIPTLPTLLFFIELKLKSDKPFRNIGLNLVAYFYIAIPLCLSCFISFMDGVYIGVILLGILFIVWANDTGAYIIGSLIGRNKLLPHVSPNKTIEGFLGGGAMCFVLAFFITTYISKLPWFENLAILNSSTWYFVALIVFLFATTGDLIESLLKRSLNIKDSGSIMPGHGGFLDRFDAFLYVIPFVVAGIKIFN